MTEFISKYFKAFGVTATLLYTLSLLTFFILRMVLPTLPPILTLVNCFVPFLFIPTLFIFPLALLFKSRIMAGASVILLILFLSLYGGLFIPRCHVPETDGKPVLRVMTFNLAAPFGQYAARVIAIKQQHADIVAVQEMTPKMKALLKAGVETYYPYTALRPETESTGLLSRFPILNADWKQIPGKDRTYLHAVIDWEGIALNVVVLHPLYPELMFYGDSSIPIGMDDSIPQRQVMEAITQISSLEGMTLVMGDFNISDQTRAYKKVAKHFVDVYRESGRGFGFTFPKGWKMFGVTVPGPLTRFDYMFRSEGLYTRQAQVGYEGGSDHCYLVAEFSKLDAIR